MRKPQATQSQGRAMSTLSMSDVHISANCPSGSMYGAAARVSSFSIRAKATRISRRSLQSRHSGSSGSRCTCRWPKHAGSPRMRLHACRLCRTELRAAEPHHDSQAPGHQGYSNALKISFAPLTQSSKVLIDQSMVQRAELGRPFASSLAADQTID